MNANGKPSLVDAINSVTLEDLTELDKAIADKTTAMQVLEGERAALVRLRGYAATILGVSKEESVARRGAIGDGALYRKIETLIRSKGPLTVADIASSLGRKEGGVKLAIRKLHFRFKIVDGDKIDVVASA